MKTFLRVLAVSLFLTTFGIVSAFAQTEEKALCPDLESCFEIFKAEIRKPCGQRAKAIEVGKYIGEKFKDDKDNEELVKKIKASALKMEGEDPICQRSDAYNAAYKAKNWDNFFSAGKAVINSSTTEKPLALDVMIDLMSIGLYHTAGYKDYVQTDKYNNDTMMFAKSVIQNIQSGVASEKYGIFEPFKSSKNTTAQAKDDTLSWSYYTIGYILYDRQGKKDDAIPYFYKATQVGEKKTDTLLFIRIGKWYGDQATALFEQYEKINTSIKTAATEEDKTKLNDEAKSKLALARGYAERAIDAYARAHKIASADKTTKPEFLKGLNAEITQFYKFRFNKAEGQTEFVSALIAKPMPDPATAVTPVFETTTPTTTSSTTPEVKPVTTTPEVKPTTTVKTSTTTTPAKTTKGATTTKTTTKKPVTKKKGNR
jgi:tetratricopeptide (TPR) repeat protein